MNITLPATERDGTVVALVDGHGARRTVESATRASAKRDLRAGKKRHCSPHSPGVRVDAGGGVRRPRKAYRRDRDQVPASPRDRTLVAGSLSYHCRSAP